MCDLENGDFLILNYTGGAALILVKKKNVSVLYICEALLEKG